MKAAPTAAILDPPAPSAASTAPKHTHMFVIDPTGKLIYAGSPRRQTLPDPESLKGAKNYVSTASKKPWPATRYDAKSPVAMECAVKVWN